MKTAIPAIIALLSIASFAFWEFGNVIVLDGSYELPVVLSDFDPESVSRVSYATIDHGVTQMAIDQSPSTKPAFNPITEDGATLTVSFGSYWSPLLRREWGYSESFDTVLFRIEYKNSDPEFRAIDVPDRKPGATTNLKF